MNKYSEQEKMEIISTFEDEYRALLRNWAYARVSVPQSEATRLARGIVPKVNAICELAALSLTEEMKGALNNLVFEVWLLLKTYKQNLEAIAQQWNGKVHHEYVDKCLVEIAHVLNDVYRWIDLGLGEHRHYIIASKPLMRDTLNPIKVASFLLTDTEEAMSDVLFELQERGYGVLQVEGGFTLVSYNGVSL